MDNSNSVGGRRRVAATHTVEDQALDQIAKEVRKFNCKEFTKSMHILGGSCISSKLTITSNQVSVKV